MHTPQKGGRAWEGGFWEGRWRGFRGAFAWGGLVGGRGYLGPKSAFFLPKTALEPAENGQMKGNSGYSTHATKLPRAEGPSWAL